MKHIGESGSNIEFFECKHQGAWYRVHGWSIDITGPRNTWDVTVKLENKKGHEFEVVFNELPEMRPGAFNSGASAADA